jgi:hypothetical protein
MRESRATYEYPITQSRILHYYFYHSGSQNKLLSSLILLRKLLSPPSHAQETSRTNFAILTNSMNICSMPSVSNLSCNLINEGNTEEEKMSSSYEIFTDQLGNTAGWSHTLRNKKKITMLQIYPCNGHYFSPLLSITFRQTCLSSYIFERNVK